jgi:hypothetical protein
VYFGAETSQQKKLITNLSQRGSKNNSICQKDTSTSQQNNEKKRQ